MHVSQSHDDLLSNDGCIVLIQMSVVFYKLKEVFSLTKLSDNVQMSFRLYAAFVVHK